MSFGIYMAGFIIMLIGLIMGANYAHVPAHWIAVGAVVMIGVGVLLGVTNTRTKDISN